MIEKHIDDESKIKDKHKINVMIIGNGAVGMFISCCLSSLDTVSALLCARRPDAVKRINEQGITLIHRDRSSHHKIKATLLKDLSDEFILSTSLIILCIKATQTDSFIESFTSQKFGKVVNNILTLQNGMGHTEKLSDKLNIEHLFAGVNTYGITKIDDNTVKLAGKGKISIGEYPSTSTDMDSEMNHKTIAELFINTGLNAVYTDEILKEVWIKLCVNTCINSITALIDNKNGALRNSYDLYEPLLNALCEEISNVALAEGINATAQHYKDAVLNVIDNTKENKSSMLQDIENNRETEIDYITGYIIRKGKEHNIKTDVCQLLYNLVKMKSVLSTQNK
jgi:2-dehydropantoate 2-reductase